MKSMINKVLAVTLNFALVGSSFANVPGTAAGAAAKGPDFLATFTPPQSLGYVTGYFQGTTDKPVILIQDLHANYGVQKKIMGILEFLQPNVASEGKPMILGIEGAWGDVNIDWFRRKSLKVRETAGDFLLKHSVVQGMELFAGLSEKPVRMVGVENPKDYLLHRHLFEKSLKARLELASIVDKMRRNILSSKDKAPRALRQLWQMEDAYRAGKLDLYRVSKSLNVPLNNYAEAERAFEQAKLDIVARQKDADQQFFLRNVVKADQNLELLARLFRHQLTFEEVQMVSRRLPEILVSAQVLMPGMNVNLWHEVVNSSIDHYAVALLRDKPMADRAVDLSRANTDRSVVVVTGGFHTAGIAERLRAQKISHVMIAPVVESHTSHDEKSYLRRMLGAFQFNKNEVARYSKKYASALTLPGTPGIPTPAPGTLASDKLAHEVVRGAVEGTVPTATGASDAASLIENEAGRPAVETGGVVGKASRVMKDAVSPPEAVMDNAEEPKVDGVKGPDLGAIGVIGGGILSASAVGKLYGLMDTASGVGQTMHAGFDPVSIAVVSAVAAVGYVGSRVIQGKDPIPPAIRDLLNSNA